MEPIDNDPFWQKLIRALFGVRKTTDEGLFVLRVMEEIRKMEITREDLAFPRFLRWAIPALGVGLLSFFLAARSPLVAASLHWDQAILQPTESNDDTLNALEEIQ